MPSWHYPEFCLVVPNSGALACNHVDLTLCLSAYCITLRSKVHIGVTPLITANSTKEVWVTLSIGAPADKRIDLWIDLK